MPINEQQLKGKSQRARQVELLYKLSGYLKPTSLMDSNILSPGYEYLCHYAALPVIYLHNSGTNAITLILAVLVLLLKIKHG